MCTWKRKRAVMLNTASTFSAILPTEASFPGCNSPPITRWNVFFDVDICFTVKDVIKTFDGHCYCTVLFLIGRCCFRDGKAKRQGHQIMKERYMGAEECVLLVQQVTVILLCKCGSCKLSQML